MDISTVVVDFDMEAEGVWFDYDNETSVKVARSNCKAYRKAMKRVMKPYRRQIKMNTIDPELFDKLLATAMAEGLVRDWKGLLNNGQPIEYSRSKSIELMVDPVMREFKEFVAECAEDAEAFRNEEIEEDAGN